MNINRRGTQVGPHNTQTINKGFCFIHIKSNRYLVMMICGLNAPGLRKSSAPINCHRVQISTKAQQTPSSGSQTPPRPLTSVGSAEPSGSSRHSASSMGSHPFSSQSSSSCSSESSWSAQPSDESDPGRTTGASPTGHTTWSQKHRAGFSTRSRISVANWQII